MTFVCAFVLMRDIGFAPGRSKHPVTEVKRVIRGSIEHGLGHPPVRWVMLAAPFTGGVTMYAFYAMQPYLLQLYGNAHAYGIARLAAAIVAGAEIAGGLLVPHLDRIFQQRTSVMLAGTGLSVAILALIGLVPHFWSVIALAILWSLMFAAFRPVRQAYLNDHIASDDRATVLSFDSLLGSSGAVVIQPLLGKAADVWSYPVSYLFGSAIQAMAIPFYWKSKNIGKG